MRRDTLLAEIAEERGRALVGYAFLLTGDLAEAEDLAQEALVRTMLRSRAGVDLSDARAAEAYVRRAIASIFVDGHRRRRRWLDALPTLATRQDGPRASEADPALGADALDLRAALMTLPRQERACVVLRFYEDMTVPQVADVLGLAQGTVKRYLSQGLARLGEVVRDADDDVEITWRTR